MHKKSPNPALRVRPAAAPRPLRPHLSATHIVRAATRADVGDVHELVERYSAAGALLPRSVDAIALAIDAYVVVTDGHDRVVACAALYEYSPSLAEVGSVAVHPDAQGQGLGTIAVLGAETMARRRGIGELFAMSAAERFFESLGFSRTSLSRYPEKVARYDMLRRGGVEIIPRTCFRKLVA